MPLPRSARLTALATLAALGLSACGPQPGANVYSTGQVMQAAQVQRGVITDVRLVETRSLERGDQSAGAVAGGALGALVGNQFGGDGGRAIMTGLGALAGGAAGSNIARDVNRNQAAQWFVELQSGQTISVIQNDPSLRVGMPVRVISDGGSTRLVR